MEKDPYDSYGFSLICSYQGSEPDYGIPASVPDQRLHLSVGRLNAWTFRRPFVQQSPPSLEITAGGQFWCSACERNVDDNIT